MPNGSPVVWFEYVVNDLEAARAFYEELLGWTFAQLDGYDVPYLTITNDAEDSVSGGLIGATAERPAGGGGAAIYAGVPDLPQAISAAERLGGRKVQDSTTIEGAGTFAIVADPDGNELGLWQL